MMTSNTVFQGLMITCVLQERLDDEEQEEEKQQRCLTKKSSSQYS